MAAPREFHGVNAVPQKCFPNAIADSDGNDGGQNDAVIARHLKQHYDGRQCRAGHAGHQTRHSGDGERRAVEAGLRKKMPKQRAGNTTQSRAKKQARRKNPP